MVSHSPRRDLPPILDSQSADRRQSGGTYVSRTYVSRTYVIRRILVVVAAVTALLLVVAGVAAAVYVSGVNKSLADKVLKVDPKAVAQLTLPKSNADPFYILVMGADTRPKDQSVARSDTMMLARVDPKQKRIALISIPRDTRVQIPGGSVSKINSALEVGGPSLAIKTVKQLTGLPIAHFIVIDFNGFKDVVDAIGGIWVNVPTRINDLEAAAWVRRAAVIPAGYQKLDGKHALTFVRTRHGYVSGDYQRMLNQQQFVKALAKQTLQIQNVLRVTQIVQAGVKNVTTDMTVQDFLGLAGDFVGAPANRVETATMPSHPQYIGGVAYVILDRPAMRTMLDRFAAGQPLSTKAGAASAASTGRAGVVQPAQVTLTVHNGSGGKGVAAHAAAVMSKAGYVVKQTGNAARMVYDQTLVIYKSDQAKAEAVTNTLGFGVVVPSKGLYAFSTDVLLVVGKDWHDPSGAGH